MKKIGVFLIIFCFCSEHIISQTNILFTNSTSEQVLKGNFNPNNYLSSTPINQHDAIVSYIQNNMSHDSLKAYILKLAMFENRNTASDTVSSTTGIGAARRWAFQKFSSFSAQAENRLIPSYFQFDKTICNVTQHRNVIGVLPGTDTSNHEVIIIEGHMDSRCENECDITCQAQGIEDNASGSALVLELARVMSKCSYKNTIVFMLTIGEEQGLYGADAFADYCNLNDIPVKAVLNNDVIGGIICGQTSSAPSCPGLNNIDSTQVRIFSYGGYNSIHKQLARFIKLQYKEELLPQVNVPMMVTIMSGEDRSGRGGDHIPFRQNGFASCRFTSANEHGDASNGPGYTDRQHTTDDVLGVDTNLDGTIDSFFVDFNYLARNACINGTGAAIAAIGPKKPDFNTATVIGPGIIIHVLQEANYSTYRVGLRSVNNDWDSVYTISGYYDTIFPPVSNVYYVSIASVDENGLESLFSKEVVIQNSQISVPEIEETTSLPIELLQNKPNPFDEATIIGVLVNMNLSYKKAEIVFSDMNGKIVEKLPIELAPGVNEAYYEHGYGKTGTYFYTLVVDGKEIARKTMIFAN
ncbi:MAG: M28 family peptidase [Crocinitomicaceae bacterium]